MTTTKTILNIEKPTTQTVGAVKALLAWRGRASDPLPEFVELSSNGSRCVLVLSNKRDCYYVTTGAACSCPAASWHPGQRCKHQRAHFPETATVQKQSIEETLREAEANLPKMPYQYQRMVKAAREAAESEPSELIPHKPFRPFIEDDGKPTGTAKEPSSSPVPLVDTLGEPGAGELAYWSIAEDKALWPLCEA